MPLACRYNSRCRIRPGLPPSRPGCRPPAALFTGAHDEKLLQTTIAGSLPKPAWLATPGQLWAPWLLEGEALAEG